MVKNIKVVLLFGGRSEEHEVPIMSARSVMEEINRDKYEIIPVAIDKRGLWHNLNQSMTVLKENKEKVPLKKGKIPESIIPFLKTNADVVFPILHGPYGEDGKIQGFFETLDIPYVGSSVTTSALAMDKAFMKQLLAHNNLPQTNYKIIYKKEYNNLTINQIYNKYLLDFLFPIFIKPANLGSSIGISKIKTKENLKKGLKKAFSFDNKIIIEEGVRGREIECSVLGRSEIKASLPGEILPAKEFYDYQAKYEDKSTKLKVPAELDKNISKKIQNLAVKAFKIIDGDGMARVDFFLDEKKNILINEINTIPGFTQYSMYARMWEATGIKYKNLIDRLIELALS
ncbi:MAG: D-alanine--D-alanine ligase family protein [Halanaerobiales bacterium]